MKILTLGDDGVERWQDQALTQPPVPTSEEWLDVTPHFHLEYRRRPGVEVYLGLPGALPASKHPVLSVGLLRTAKSLKIDAFVRFGDGLTAFRATLDSGTLLDGWELVCYDHALDPAAGGIGIAEIHSSDPHQGEQLGMARWYKRPDGKWAIEPKLFQTYGFTAGNITWSYPMVSGHSIFEFPGSSMRMDIGPYRRAS
ncbi:MAG: hypothetical protein A2Y74_00995 [Actinobacteria bacterium RBG_13_63_9]|nr:MAG: hypothetical protein A2Y74_00995 [Actinobacteria bacterium RBG_13_63_9]